MKKKWFFVIIFLSLAITPMIFHSDVYGVINNDTRNHLAAFESMRINGYHGLYGGQVILGLIVNSLPRIISPQISFMIFNFLSLAMAGFSVGFMVYRLSGSTIGGLLSMPLVVWGTGATMHLFYSGTIFNIVGVLILVPLLITIAHYIFVKRRYKLLFMLIPLSILMAWFHPSLGLGVFILRATMLEATLNPFESIMRFTGIMPIFLLLTNGYILITSKDTIAKINRVIVFGILGIVIATGIIAFVGLNPFPSRVAMNMSLFLAILTAIVMGFALNKIRNKTSRYGIIALCVMSFAPGLYKWIVDSIVRGLPANVILS